MDIKKTAAAIGAAALGFAVGYVIRQRIKEPETKRLKGRISPVLLRRGKWETVYMLVAEDGTVSEVPYASYMAFEAGEKHTGVWRSM